MLKRYNEIIDEKDVKNWKIYNFYKNYDENLNDAWDEFFSEENSDCDAFKIETEINIFDGDDYRNPDNYHSIDLICVDGPRYNSCYTYISMTDLFNGNYSPIKYEIGRMLYSLPKLENKKFYKLDDNLIIKAKWGKFIDYYKIAGVMLRPVEMFYNRQFIDVLGPKETYFFNELFK